MKHWTEFIDSGTKLQIVKNNKDHRKNYCNNVFVLDTETSSYYLIDGEYQPFDMSKSPEWYSEHCKGHFSFVYIWMLSVDDTVYYGRDLLELPCFLGILHRAIGAKFFVYIHNMAFDFCFLRNVLKFSDIFAREKGKPLVCTCEEYNVVFRDSLILTQMSLASLAESYKLDAQKKVGDLDYKVARTTKTVLSEKELGYCEADCLVLYEYISKYELPQWGGKIKNIPMTQTSKVRRALKKYITQYHKGLPQYALKDWRRMVSKMHPDAETYLMLVNCFSGGYTHANCMYTGEVIKDVKSCDFTSSYPAVMLSKKYPMTAWYKTTNDPSKWRDNYAYMATFTFTNVRPKSFNHFISESKCYDFVNAHFDNGRMVDADKVTVSMIDPDWRTFQKAYAYSSVKVKDAKRSKLGYLPLPIAMLIVDYFEQKLKLKPEVKANPDDGGLNALYVQIKQYINSIFGMSVTKFINGLSEWDNISCDWIDKIEKSEEEEYDEIKQRINDLNGEEMMTYAWGVYVAAYARENLWDGILAIDCDVVYCDTDSIKYIGDHDDYFNDYNGRVHKMMEESSKHYGFELSRIGDLGEWDTSDGDYSSFVTLGAKKYSYVDRKQNDLHITVSGVNKSSGAKALKSIRDFKIGLIFNYENSGRTIAYHDDDQPLEVTLKDCNGVEDTIVGMKYGVCLQPTTYKLGISQDYLSYTLGVQNDPYVLSYINIDSYSSK